MGIRIIEKKTPERILLRMLQIPREKGEKGKWVFQAIYYRNVHTILYCNVYLVSIGITLHFRREAKMFR